MAQVAACSYGLDLEFKLHSKLQLSAVVQLRRRMSISLSITYFALNLAKTLLYGIFRAGVRLEVLFLVNKNGYTGLPTMQNRVRTYEQNRVVYKIEAKGGVYPVRPRTKSGVGECRGTFWDAVLAQF